MTDIETHELHLHNLIHNSDDRNAIRMLAWQIYEAKRKGMTHFDAKTYVPDRYAWDAELPRLPQQPI